MKTVAYVCLEYALEDNLPIYAGGLGVLAGDLMLETPPEEFHMVGLGIFYSHGFHAHHEKGRIDPTLFGFETLKDISGNIKYFSTNLGTEEVWFQVWKKTYNQSTVYLLDTDIAINNESHRNITKHLYGPTKDIMLSQQIVLGFGLVKILKSENLAPDYFHLNEGHTAMTLLGLSNGDAEKLNEVKKISIATKHTVLTGGGLYISKEEFKQKLSFLKNTDSLFELGTNTTHKDMFATTNFLLRYTKIGSAVSVAHAKAEKELHPHSNLVTITNGINLTRWQKQPIDPETISDLDLWQLHQGNKVKMLDFLENETGIRLSPNTLTISWARRFVSYKRPDLLFKNVDELTKITSLFPSVQFVIAGQTNPNDADAQDIKDQIKATLEAKNLATRICFLENYNLKIAQQLVAGSDVWLNTPTPGIEASGTSGMKAGANGDLEFSTNDGWMSEVNWDDIGWILKEEHIAQDLYKILETEIFPLYYKINDEGLPSEWLGRMKRTIRLVEGQFTTKRVLKDYWEKLYNTNP